MTVIEAINEVNRLKPNMYETPAKIHWLFRLELRIWHNIYDRHHYNEGEEEIPQPSFGNFTEETELQVGEPWSEMYIHWLEAQIDYNNLEYDGFNASNAMFESVYGSYRNAYHQCHRPKSRKNIYF